MVLSSPQTLPEKHVHPDSPWKHANGSPQPNVYLAFIIPRHTCWLFFFYMDSGELVSAGLDLHARGWWNFWRAAPGFPYVLTRIVSLKYELPLGIVEWCWSKLNIRCLLLSLYDKLFISMQTYWLMQKDYGCVCCFWMCYFPMMWVIYCLEPPNGMQHLLYSQDGAISACTYPLTHFNNPFCMK